MDETFYINRGISERKAKKYDFAVLAFTKAIEVNPNCAEAYYNRGIGFNGLKRYRQAIADFNKALELNSNNDFRMGVYVNREKSYAELKQYDLAIQDCNKIIELNPNFHVGYLYRSECYRALGNNAKAEADYKKYEELLELHLLRR